MGDSYGGFLYLLPILDLVESKQFNNIDNKYIFLCGFIHCLISAWASTTINTEFLRNNLLFPAPAPLSYC